MARLFPSYRRSNGLVYVVPINGSETLPVPRGATRYPFKRMKPGDRCFVPLNPLAAPEPASQRANIGLQLKPFKGNGIAFDVTVGSNQHGWWIACRKASIRLPMGISNRGAGAAARAKRVEMFKRKAALALLED